MTQRSRLIKVGVIGCGRVAEFFHLPALTSLPETEVVAVADVDVTRLNRVAERFHIEHRYTDFQALLRQAALDVVAVCVPAPAHASVALAALDAGKHLLIEKPLALSLDDCDQLIERAHQQPVKVTVGFNMRQHRLVRRARAMIQQGALGALESVYTAMTSGVRYDSNTPDWRKRRAQGYGALFEMAVHHFDMWRFLLQSEVEEVFATSRSAHWDDESATVTARMANGVLASAVFAEGTSPNNELNLCGQAGRLHISCYRFDGFEFSPSSCYPGDVRLRLRRIAHLLKEAPQTVSILRQGGDWLTSYRTEWQHFIEAIQRDAPVECALEDGRRAVQVALAAAASASLGRPVKVAQAPRTIPPVADENEIFQRMKSAH